MERATASLEWIKRVLHHEFSEELGKDASGYMRNVKFEAATGEPNWTTIFPAGSYPEPLNIVSAFDNAVARVKAKYNVNDADRTRLPCQGSLR